MDAESLDFLPCMKQTTVDNLKGKHLDNSTRCKFTRAVAKWMVTECRPIGMVEEDSLREIMASKNWTYELPCRATSTKKIHHLHENEGANMAVVLRQTSTVVLTGDYWTSLGNYSYPGVTAHYFDSQWGLQSLALAAMKQQTGISPARAQGTVNT